MDDDEENNGRMALTSLAGARGTSKLSTQKLRCIGGLIVGRGLTEDRRSAPDHHCDHTCAETDELRQIAIVPEQE